ncbi:MAG: filamentous hemagglutinin N-terminal domain-containing protein, partial [Chroococcidiopsis sp.]
TANAFTGTGGNIEITSQAIFGIQPRREATLETNDITATSELGISGRIQLNGAEIDFSRDIVELPTGLVDASSLVAAGCPSGAENRFTVAGRGGLPPAPADKLSPDALLTDWATLQTPETQNRAAVETTTPVATNTTPTPPVETITEATFWQYDRNGAIILTSGDTTSSSHLKTTPTSCPSS